MADLPQQEDKLYWEINCDGYYPYCPKCLNEPWPPSRNLPEHCPKCGVRLYKRTFDTNENKGKM